MVTVGVPGRRRRKKVTVLQLCLPISSTNARDRVPAGNATFGLSNIQHELQQCSQGKGLAGSEIAAVTPSSPARLVMASRRTVSN